MGFFFILFFHFVFSFCFSFLFCFFQELLVACNFVFELLCSLEALKHFFCQDCDFNFNPLFFCPLFFIKMYVFALRQSLMVALATLVAKPETLSSMMRVFNAVIKPGAMVLAIQKTRVTKHRFCAWFGAFCFW